VKRRLLLVAAALTVAAAVAVPIIVVFAGGGGDHGTTRAGYLARVNAVCRRYEAKLKRIPTPANFADPAMVRASVSRALPVVERRVEEVRAIEPPAALRRRVTRMLAAADAATAALRTLLAAANAGDVPSMGRALARFLSARDAGRLQSAALGITC
jgi:hypothetical protein